MFHMKSGDENNSKDFSSGSSDADNTSKTIDNSQNKTTKEEEAYPSVLTEENLDNIRSAAQRLTSVLEEKDALVKYLESEVEGLSKKNREFVDKFRSLHADFENARRRHASDLEGLSSNIVKNIFKDLLNLLDNFDRCKNLEDKIKSEIEEPAKDLSQDNQDHIFKKVQSFLKGFDMISYEMLSVMKKYHIETISVKVGDKFDLEIHDAIQTMPSQEHKPGTVLMIINSGYKLNDKVLRHAKVVIAE